MADPSVNTQEAHIKPDVKNSHENPKQIWGLTSSQDLWRNDCEAQTIEVMFKRHANSYKAALHSPNTVDMKIQNMLE